MFVIQEFHICYKERSMQGVCHNGITQLVEEEWKVYIRKDFPFSYTETMVSEKSWCLL